MQAADGEQLELAGADVRDAAERRIGHHIDVPAQKVRQRRRAAPIGHVHHVNLGHLLEHLERQVRDLSAALRGIAELARVGARIRDKLRHVAGRQVRAGDHEGRVGRDNANRHQGARIERKLCEQQMRDAQGAGRGAQQRIAVGACAGDVFRADIAAAPRTVFDDDRLPEDHAQLVGDEPRLDIGRAAGRKRHHDRDRPGREGRLGCRRVGQADQEQQPEASAERRAKHALPPGHPLPRLRCC